MALGSFLPAAVLFMSALLELCRTCYFPAVFDLMPAKEMCCCSPVDAHRVFAVFGPDPLATSSTLATVKVALRALQFDEMPSHVDHAAKSRLVQVESM
ncbi:hypothetical protein ZEAMMB73_Zm00001d016040 [Zea mays]|uniref:Uncharacterized protein n=1 Tax=Zea mays TaxID=4577 RepID=A0A1D6H562_MAIZE|nr:hypothetical protein ZEAMMB73_Zm00001d016040 [Zea mays]